MTDLLEEDIELLAKYKKYKDSEFVMLRDRTSQEMFVTFSLEELMRLSKIMENDNHGN